MVAGRIWLAVTALGILILFAATVQQQWGTFSRTTWTLPPAAKLKQDGFAWKTRLPAWATGSLAEQEVRLLHHGKPLGLRVNHASTVVNKGEGAFKIQRDYIYFSLPGNAELKTYLPGLSLSVPRPVNPYVWLAGALLAAGGGFAMTRQAHARTLAVWWLDKFQNAPAMLLLVAVFALGLGLAALRMPESRNFSDGSFSVKGVPYSDASGWDELAIYMSEGRGFIGGFGGQRPLYPVMTGFLYAMTGPSLWVGKALNAIWLALAATAVCAIGIKGGSRLAGMAGALHVLLGADYVTFSQLMLTETLGVLLGAAAVLALVVSFLRPDWWRIVLAALLLSCSNLASGFGFFALVGYGLVAFGAWVLRCGWLGATWRVVLLAGMVGLGWVPWIVRQHQVHGITNLSANSAILMYSAATEHQTWSSETASRWEKEGIPDEIGARYRFYMSEYSRLVKENPGRYLSTVGRGMMSFLQWWTFEGSDRFGLVLLALMVATIFTFRHAGLPATLLASGLIIGVCVALHGQPSHIIWPLATILALMTCPPQRRSLWALVAIGIPFVALLAGLTGGNLGRRMWTFSEWSMPLLLVAGGSHAMRLLALRLDRLFSRNVTVPAPHQAEKTDAPAKERRTRKVGHYAQGVTPFATVLSSVLIAHAAAGSIALTTLYVVHRGDPVVDLSIPAEMRQQARTAAAEKFAPVAALPEGDPRLLIIGCKFREYVAEIGAGENENHWARSFEIRPYTRTVAFCESVDRAVVGSTACQFRLPASDLPRNKPLLLIGVRNYDPQAHLGHDAEMIEVVGYAPLRIDKKTGAMSADFSRSTWLPITPEAEKVLKGEK